MQPKILSLYNEAMTFTGTAGNCPLETQVFLDKFSRLILQEVINEIHAVDLPIAGKSYYTDVVANHIEKHFGVSDYLTSTNSSWEGQVDRQSGAFTQEEIENSTTWR